MYQQGADVVEPCDRLNPAGQFGPVGPAPLQTNWPGTIPGAQWLYDLSPAAQVSLTTGQTKQIVGPDQYRNLLWFSAQIPAYAGSGCFVYLSPDPTLVAAANNTSMFQLTNLVAQTAWQNLALYYWLHGFIVNLPWTVGYLGAGTAVINAWGSRYRG